MNWSDVITLYVSNSLCVANKGMKAFIAETNAQYKKLILDAINNCVPKEYSKAVVVNKEKVIEVFQFYADNHKEGKDVQ